jgi:DNA-directed RNA polymerase subunit RPC12/RpoP
MNTSVQCGQCAKKFKFKVELAGRTIRCPNCQSAIKVPELVAGVKEDIEQDEPTSVRLPSKRQPKPSAVQPEGLAKKLLGWWFVPVPLVALLLCLVSPQLATVVGLGTLAIGLLFAIYGFGCAVMVDPVHALSPWARLLRSDAQNHAKWRKMAPHFARFWKGLLAVVLGCVSVWISFEMMNRGWGGNKITEAQSAANAEIRERLMNQNRGGNQPPVGGPPGFPGNGNTLPGNMPAGGFPFPVNPNTGEQTGGNASPPLGTIPAKAGRIPPYAYVPHAIVMVPVDGNFQPAEVDKQLPGDRVQVTILVPGALNRLERTSKTMEVSLDDLRQPPMGK